MKKNLTFKDKIHAFRTLWTLLKYDDPDELCFVAKWRNSVGGKNLNLTGVFLDEERNGTLLSDLRRWHLSFHYTLISHYGKLKEENEKDGLEIGKPTR